MYCCVSIASIEYFIPVYYTSVVRTEFSEISTADTVFLGLTL